MPIDNTFFDYSTEASRVKARIVTKYFWAWATALKKHVRTHGNKLSYVDLFAGPGYYKKDGVKSTPLLILESIIRDEDLRGLVIPYFNDASKTNFDLLTEAVKNLPGIETLKYQPVITNQKIGPEVATYIQQRNLVPTLLFVDPWGFKGLSIDLIWSVLRNWGSDCIFFFNYRRVNIGLPNPFLNETIDALFSPGRADKLREEIKSLSAEEREDIIIEAIKDALKEKGGEYVVDFRFRNDQDTRTRHFLIFVTKKPLGVKLMKDIMAKESSILGSEVPSFEFNPGKEKQIKKERLQMDLFADDTADAIDILAEKLMGTFSGCTMSVEKVYHSHNINTPYVQTNYRAALLRLEEKGRIVCNPAESDRKRVKGKLTLPENVLVTFPKDR